jgi:hypothetical protein
MLRSLRPTPLLLCEIKLIYFYKCVHSHWRDPILWVPKDLDYEWLSQPQWLLGYFWWLPRIIFVREDDHKSSYGITWPPACSLRLAGSHPE